MVNINFNISNLTMYEIWGIFSDYLSPDLTSQSVQLGRLKATELLFSWWLRVSGASLGNGGLNAPTPCENCPWTVNVIQQNVDVDSIYSVHYADATTPLRVPLHDKQMCLQCRSEGRVPQRRLADLIRDVVTVTSNSSGDEIANVNFLYDDIVHALQKKQ